MKELEQNIDKLKKDNQDYSDLVDKINVKLDDEKYYKETSQSQNLKLKVDLEALQKQNIEYVKAIKDYKAETKE